MNKFFLIFALLFISAKSLFGSDFSGTVKKLIPSVVQIYGKANPEMVKETVSEDYVNSSNGVVSIGTGFFISSNGLIATAYHVVHPMTDDIFVKSPYGHYTVIAKLLKFDTNADVAILKIEISGAPFVSLTNPQDDMLGDDIGFIGFPVGFPIPTVSKGIVSAEANTPFFTTQPCRLTVINAIVNHGNSGGPLFLADTGKVIGIINAKKLADVNKDKIRLPTNYQAMETLGGIDPIRLSVETYNHSLDVIGDTSQLGIGFSVSSEYIQALVGTIQ